MKLNLFDKICAGLILLTVGPLWGQVDDTPHIQPSPAGILVPDNSDNTNPTSDTRMVTPPPVSGFAYPTTFTSEERSNYFRGGVVFTSAYSDNIEGGVQPVSDESYSVAPTLALQETTPRSHIQLMYAPGFTFYQHTSSLNETDQNASIEFEYRLTPHVTFSAADGFQKSSNVFNQPSLAASEAISGAAQGGNFSVIAPIADRLSNLGDVGLTYQFSRNAEVGVSGTFSNLHYPDPSQVPGLGDASSQDGSFFYSFRVAKRHYIGAAYQYQRLISYPTIGTNETQTHALLLFYTVYPTSKLSFSFFGGPQHSTTVEPLSLPSTREWLPAAGASMNWQAQRSTFAVSYAHVVASGGGLIGAVQLDSAMASVRQQITKTLVGTLAGGYAQNDVLGSLLAGETNGHSIIGTVSARQAFGQHVSVELGYTRLRQNYSNIAVLSATPVTNREYISLAYQFQRALGK